MTMLKKEHRSALLVLLFGVGMGYFSKFLDCTPSNELPFFLEYLDVRNFLGRFGIWVLLGLWLSLRSASARWAALHALLFFFGMVSAYYLYSKFVAGFFPGRYALLWFGFAAASGVLALPCWYAGRKGIPALALCVLLLAVLFRCCFAGGWLYVYPRSLLELLVYLCGIVIVRRDSLRENVIMTALGTVLGFLLVLA